MRAAMSTGDVLRRIFVFLPTSFAGACASRLILHHFTAEIRARAVFVLGRAINRALAARVEEALFAVCGAAWPAGVYQRRLRSACLNLSQNAALRAQLERAEVSPAALVRMSEAEMLSPSLRAADRVYREAAVARLRRVAPKPHVVDMNRCTDCGSAAQWLRRAWRAGTQDVSNFSEYLVCADCSSTGPFLCLRSGGALLPGSAAPPPPQVAGGAAAGAGGGAGSCSAPLCRILEPEDAARLLLAAPPRSKRARLESSVALGSCGAP